MYTPEQLVSIYESRAKITEDLIKRHESGEICLGCVECRKADAEEFRAVALTINRLQKEAFEAKGSDAEHLLQVGKLASENAKLKALLEILKSGTYYHDCHAYQTGPQAGEPFIMLINIHVNGEEAIKAAQEWLGA